MQQKSKKPRVSTCKHGSAPPAWLVEIAIRKSREIAEEELRRKKAKEPGAEERKRRQRAEELRREKVEFYSLLKDPKTTTRERLKMFFWRWEEFVCLVQEEGKSEVSLGKIYRANYYVSENKKARKEKQPLRNALRRTREIKCTMEKIMESDWLKRKREEHYS